MPAGDLYQVVDKYTFAGQQMLNVYFYRRTAEVLAGNIAEQVADSWVATVLPDIVAMQTGDVLHTEVVATNLFDGADTATVLISESGELAGDDTAAPFDAVGFRLRQDNGSIRNGAKRIGGVPDSFDTDGVIAGGGVITLLLAAGAAMLLGLDAGIVSNAFLPIVVKRILDGGSYRLPENSGEGVWGNIVDALYNANMTSQTSRKIGRGD